MRRIIRREDDLTLTEQVEAEEPRLYISTGSALLNLALSDRADGGYLAGKVVNEIGDRSSGKTFKALTVLAEAAHNPLFDEYELIHDDAEAASEFNLRKLFGSAADRISSPTVEKGEPVHSETIQDFQRHVESRLEGNRPFIYVLDSLDALTTDEEIKHAAEVRKAAEAGREAKGTYGMEKAKHASVMLRLLVAGLKRTKSLVIVISQTRDNIDPMSFTRKTRSGGKALEFYASYESWLAVTGKISANVNGKPRPLGITTRCKVTKNKATGKLREIDLPIYYDLGVDDVGACVDWLVSEGRWSKSGSGIVDARDLRIEATKTKLIRKIEEDDLVEPLHKVTQDEWLKIESKLKLDRKPRYQ